MDESSRYVTSWILFSKSSEITVVRQALYDYGPLRYWIKKTTWKRVVAFVGLERDA